MSEEVVEQMSFSLFDATEVVSHYANVSAEERGAVFTRREVVDFILDLLGYTQDRKLYEYRLLEPSLGEGDFLLPALERLLDAYQDHASDSSGIVPALNNAVRAVEVHAESITKTRGKILDLLFRHGISKEDARLLVDAWILKGDYLLLDFPFSFTHIVGNPPYVRQELIPDHLMTEYRARFRTIYDRADLYIPFYEKSLSSLAPGGSLGFICSDRWMKNKYGKPLREMISRHFHMLYYIDMVDTPAFNAEVIAYPAITVIKREKPGPTRIAHRPRIDHDELKTLSAALFSSRGVDGKLVSEVVCGSSHGEPWILHSLDRLAVVRRLEKEYPTLEDAGCKVGIGVATGADKVFIASYDCLEVEPERKLPLLTTRDIESGTIHWTGLGVLNPFNDDGALVDLVDYPKFARYLEKHGEVIRKRNCARNNPHAWYRTIDRIYRELVDRPKLLIPDIKGTAHIVYDAGGFYPHHNLYYIISDDWDLLALQGVLGSGIAELFVAAYSTRMRGGYLRFQAQYLRRIRLPRWRDVSEHQRQALVAAAKTSDYEAALDIVVDLYHLNPEERAILEESRSQQSHADQNA